MWALVSYLVLTIMSFDCPPNLLDNVYLITGGGGCGYYPNKVCYDLLDLIFSKDYNKSSDIF
jgi:hypothetical protein